MRTIFQTSDVQFIKNIISPVYEELAYDDSPTLEKFVPEGIWFVLVDGSDVAGFISLKKLNNIMWECHVYVFEMYRGQGTEQWGKQVAREMSRKYGARKFLAITPYEAAKKYAERIGFKYLCTLKHSIKKDGKTLNQFLLEMDSPEGEHV